MASYPPPPPPPGYGGPPPPGSYGGFPPAKSTSGKAIAALICGICAFIVCPLIGIAAVILGPQAKREITASPQQFEGTGMAQAGQILGWISIGLMVAGVLLFAILLVIGAATSSSSSFGSLAALAA